MLWKRAVVRSGTPLRKALEALDQAHLQVVLVVDERGVLKGILTDGDVRRLILNGADLSGAVDQVMNRTPRTIPTNTSRAVADDLFKRLVIAHLPVVDDDGHLVGLETLRSRFEDARSETAVVLMAGGFGRRLAPITDRMPKPLVPVNDKPILEHTIIALAQHKLSRIFISVNYKREMIKDHFRDGSKWGVQIEYLEENEPRGTAGALSLMPRNGGAPSQVLVINGDILTNLDFTALLDFHGQQGNPATMCVRQHSTPIPYGVVQFDGPHMEQIVEKPEHVCFISAGVYVLSSNAIEKIPNDGFFDMPELFKVLMRDGKRPGVFPLREVWVDIGSHKDLARAGDELEKIMALRSGSPSIPLVLNGVPRPQKLGARTTQPVSADRDWHTNGSARSASS